jgi:hypothetical protein
LLLLPAAEADVSEGSAVELDDCVVVAVVVVDVKELQR